MIEALASRRACFIVLTIGCVLSTARGAGAQTRESLAIRGHEQSLRVYGTRGGPPVIVSSGDGGWMHLGPFLPTHRSRLQ